MNALPPDRGQLLTEQRHPKSMQLDELGIDAGVSLMIDDHADVLDAVRRARPMLSRFIEALIPRVRDGGRLIYIGAGTSGRLGVLDASECPPTFQSPPEQVVGVIAGGDRALRVSSEGMEDDPHGADDELGRLRLNERDTLVGIAAGGTTPYVLGALTFARECEALTALLTCAPVSSTLPSCDHLIVLETGPEVLTGSTRLKAGSATKLALNIISTTLFVHLGKTYSNLMVDLRASNAKLLDRAIRIMRTFDSNLSRDAAHRILDESRGELKTAILMHHTGADAEASRNMLSAHGGRLRKALEDAGVHAP